MLTKPDIADELIISRFQDEYTLHVSTLTFLPLGADMGTTVYRVLAGPVIKAKMQDFLIKKNHYSHVN